MTTKIVNDPVHGFIELHPLAVKIIDTPQFQRLRFIKQLGAVYYVYPGASHNRFEHSIGTYHVAGMLMKELQKHSSKSQQRAPPKKEAKSDNNEQMKENKEENNVSDAHEAETPDDRSQDEPYRQESSMEGTTHSNGSQNSDNYEKSKSEETLPQIDDTDILCVQIAALCHNLGHGPFSHVFSSMFIPNVCENENKNWKYEQSSVLMFDVLYEELKESFEYWNISGKKKQLIKDCIYPERVIKKEEGREFLYEVVSNKRSGVDVGKFDSFARDCIHLGMRSNFDHNRFLKTARLVKYQYPDEKSPIWTIAFRDKDEDDVYQLFHTRRTLHERAYQHPVSKAVEVMITDALKKVNEEVKIKGENGTEFKMSESINDMVAYTKLTDEVVYRIMHSDPEPDDSEKYCEAREILKRIMMRSLYKVIWEKKFINNGQKHGEKIEKKLRECIECQLMGENNNMAEFDQLVVLYRFPLDYGKNKGNPAHNVTFYHKKEPTKGIPYDSVVSNDRSGIDVDKFDYFARDCYHLGMHSNFDHNRFLKTARLVKYQYPGEDNEVWTIAFRKKDEDEVYQLFHTRRTLHERAYQHPVSKAVEVMITDALMRVNNDVKIQDKDGKDLKMSEAINDMVAYTKLTDEVVYRIINSDPKPDDSKEYCEARDILKRIMERSLYPVIWEKKFENNGPKDGKKIEEKLRENITSHFKDKQGMTDKFHQLVELYRFPLDYGKNKGNPAKSVTFYDKKDPTKGISCDSASHSAIYPVAKTCFYAYFRQQSKKRTEEESKQIEIFQEALDKAGEEI